MEPSTASSEEAKSVVDSSKLQKGANLLFEALKKETIKQKNDEVRIDTAFAVFQRLMELEFRIDLKFLILNFKILMVCITIDSTVKRQN